MAGNMADNYEELMPDAVVWATSVLEGEPKTYFLLIKEKKGIQIPLEITWDGSRFGVTSKIYVPHEYSDADFTQVGTPEWDEMELRERLLGEAMRGIDEDRAPLRSEAVVWATSTPRVGPKTYYVLIKEKDGTQVPLSIIWNAKKRLVTANVYVVHEYSYTDHDGCDHENDECWCETEEWYEMESRDRALRKAMKNGEERSLTNISTQDYEGLRWRDKQDL